MITNDIKKYKQKRWINVIRDRNEWMYIDFNKKKMKKNYSSKWEWEK